MRGRLVIGRLVISTLAEALNGFMSYVRRQRAGSQEYGDKRLHEDQADYEILLGEEDKQE